MTASDKALRYTAKAAKGTLTVCVWTAKGTYRLSAATAKAIRQEVQTRQWEAARAKEALPEPASSTKFASLGKNARPIGATYPGLFAGGPVDVMTTALPAALPRPPPGARILDACCGSGTIGAALLAASKEAGGGARPVWLWSFRRGL